MCHSVSEKGGILKEATSIFGFNLLWWIFSPLFNAFYISCWRADVTHLWFLAEFAI